ncbi:RNA polymerase-binding transcription factor DksA [Amycolatopsis pretoriensis]|uniref:RNA polymerase-binding transcription factor DksA n=1 Tax=Amycolatopsis pretoriensis TaxID=218821 RepID=A0A1H5QEQ5_9PSEU|nr:RNA polymerase-binding transcription factor DksA [Amycolatopsis pretoriensis]
MVVSAVFLLGFVPGVTTDYDQLSFAGRDSMAAEKSRALDSRRPVIAGRDLPGQGCIVPLSAMGSGPRFDSGSFGDEGRLWRSWRGIWSSVVDERAAAERIKRAQAETERLAAALKRQRDEIVAASEFTSGDDEHDPEGATIAFERAQVQALLVQAQDELVALGQAAQRVLAGVYEVCERCGGPIGEGRLMALPATRICIDCANRI